MISYLWTWRSSRRADNICRRILIFSVYREVLKQSNLVLLKERGVGVGVDDMFWLFIFTLNQAKSLFNSIFNSKLDQKYSFKREKNNSKLKKPFAQFSSFQGFRFIFWPNLSLWLEIHFFYDFSIIYTHFAIVCPFSFIQFLWRFVHSINYSFKKKSDYSFKRKIHLKQNLIIH